jgi:hypothetical protein
VCACNLRNEGKRGLAGCLLIWGRRTCYMVLCIRERRYLRVEISGVRQNERFASWLAATRTAFFFRLLYGMAGFVFFFFLLLQRGSARSPPSGRPALALAQRTGGNLLLPLCVALQEGQVGNQEPPPTTPRA